MPLMPSDIKRMKTKEQQVETFKREYRALREKMRLLQVVQARDKYSKYVEVTHAYDRDFKIAPFQVWLCDTIQDLIEGKLTNADGNPYQGILVSMPTQHGKSRCITETLPSWYLGRNPSRHVLEVSYNEDFAEKFGRRNREKITEYGQALFNISLSADKTSSLEFELAQTKGGMLSKGLGGGISGHPSDLTIVDDPYKNRQDADSPSYTKFVIDEWLNTVRPRASSRCKYIVVHTRWNENDLIGYLLENEPDKWFEIRLPIIAEEDEPNTGRKKGDALLPEAGKDAAWVAEFKESFLADPSGGGLRAWNALMRQQPSSLEGNMLKRAYWQHYDLTQKMLRKGYFDEWIQSWDCSFKDSDGSDKVAGGVWGRKGAKYFLVDIRWDRMDIVRTIKEVKDVSRAYPKAIAKYIEDKANGPGVISTMRATVPGLIPVSVSKSKGERVNAVLPLFEAGNVYIPTRIETSVGVWQPCLWANAVIDQCATFNPAKKNREDDLVDMITQALSKMMFAYVPGAEDRSGIVGYASEAELEDMGIVSLKPRKPGKSVVSW